jgi:predicted SAM-dependent methyltransferase
MHDTARKYGQAFYDAYIPKGQNVSIIEVGSQNVNGGLREIFTTPYTIFTGLDFVPGPGVDKVLDNPYKLPYDDQSCEVIICSSVLEHCDMFWLLFLDMVRVLKPGGLIYINVPSNGDFHRWPVDCWRFYPDAGKALQKWARHSGYDLVLLESFIGNQDKDIWNDFVAVFVKNEVYAGSYGRILDNITDYTNGYVYGKENQFLNYDPIPQDRK